MNELAEALMAMAKALDPDIDVSSLTASEKKAFNKDELLISFVRHKLSYDKYWVNSAIRLLYGNQMNDEKRLQKTLYLNMKGYNKPDAEIIRNVIAQYIILNGKLTSETAKKMFHILPKYAKQLFNMFKQVRIMAEEDLANPITRGGFKIPEGYENLFEDRGLTNRNEELGDKLEMNKVKEPLIMIGSDNNKIAGQLLEVAKILLRENNY